MAARPPLERPLYWWHSPRSSPSWLRTSRTSGSSGGWCPGAWAPVLDLAPTELRAAPREAQAGSQLGPVPPEVCLGGIVSRPRPTRPIKLLLMDKNANPTSTRWPPTGFLGRCLGCQDPAADQSRLREALNDPDGGLARRSGVMLLARQPPHHRGCGSAPPHSLLRHSPLLLPRHSQGREAAMRQLARRRDYRSRTVGPRWVVQLELLLQTNG